MFKKDLALAEKRSPKESIETSIENALENSFEEYHSLLTDISKIFQDSKDSTLIAINKIRNHAYWLIGRRIVEVEQKGDRRAGYGKQLIHNLSRDLSLKYPTGFSETNLRAMRKFYLTHPIQQPAAELSWSHYQTLLKIKDDEKRSVLEKKVRENGWSKRMLQKAINEEKLELDDNLDVVKQSMPDTTIKSTVAGLYDMRGALRHFEVIRFPNPRQKTKGLALDCGFEIFKVITKEESSGLKKGQIVSSSKRKKKPFRFKQSSVKKERLFTFVAQCERVIDGDTLLMRIDCGFGTWTRQRIRLKGIDAAPLKTGEGRRAKEYVVEALKPCAFVIVKTYKSDKYDRYLADLYYLPGESDPQTVASSGQYLNQILVDHGHAVLYSK